MTQSILSMCLHAVSKADAKAIGQIVHFTGSPCKHGHISWRSVGSSNCSECLIAFRKKPDVIARARAAERVRMEDPGHRQKMAASSRAHHHQNRDVVLEKMKGRNALYYQANKERIKQQVAEYQASRPEEHRAYKAGWERNARKTRPEYAARATMRKLISRVCERIQMSRKDAGGTESALGYTTLAFKDHIERQFAKGMSWENRAEWHVDHIIPLASFDLSRASERVAANALYNLRPIWAEENMTKGSIITTLL